MKYMKYIKDVVFKTIKFLRTRNRRLLKEHLNVILTTENMKKMVKKQKIENIKLKIEKCKYNIYAENADVYRN
ncbi:MAG: hypothetical protein PHV06_03200 [bacterium]|nr:hypothetical protein [bacterium]